MSKVILILLIFSCLGFVIRSLIIKKKRRKPIKIKPLSKMTKKEFKKAMKDLEIK